MRAVTAGDPLSLRDLLDGLVPSVAAGDRFVSALTMDSRLVQPGDVFLACSGHRHHGLRFAGQAFAAGAAMVLWEPPAPDMPTGDAYIQVPDLGARAGELAARLLRHPSRDLRVIGITGTDGKTSCAHFLAQCLDIESGPCGLIGTIGWGRPGGLKSTRHTTPDPLSTQGMLADFRDAGWAHAVMEVSSHGLDQGRVSGIEFDIAVLTNLTRDHLDYHGDAESYADAKAGLFMWPTLSAAVLNADDAFGRSLAQRVRVDERVLYGLAPPAAAGASARQVVGAELRLTQDGLELDVESAWGAGRLRSRLLGRFNASNLLAVLSVLLLEGWRLPLALTRLEDLKTVPGRMERFGGHGQPLVVVDYAHTPHALDQVLRALREHGPGRLVCVFGCGGDRDTGKRPQMAQAAEHLADRVVLTDDNPRTEDPDRIVRDIMAGFRQPGAVAVIRDRALAIAEAIGSADEGDTVLVAGKGHEDYQLVGEARLPFSDRDTVRQMLEEAA